MTSYRSVRMVATTIRLSGCRSVRTVSRRISDISSAPWAPASAENNSSAWSNGSINVGGAGSSSPRTGSGNRSAAACWISISNSRSRSMSPVHADLISPRLGVDKPSLSRACQMAAARPASPVSALRPGRTMPNRVKRRSSRAKRGSKPARRNDDLPVPDGPNTTNSDFVSASLMPRSSSSPCTIGASRPKNTAASTCSNGSQPRYGARSTSSGGGHTNECALMPVPRMASRNRYKPVGGEHHRWSAAHIDRGHVTLAEQVAPLPLRRQVITGRRLEAGTQNLLVQILRDAVFGLALMGRFPIA